MSARDVRPVRAAGVKADLIDDELLLYVPETRRIGYCNATAALVWRLCDGQRTVQEIIDVLAAAYPEAADQIPGDVDQIVELLQAQSLLVVGPAP